MSESDSNGEWAASESKDWKDGRHKRSNEHVEQHAAIVSDSKTRRHLTALSRAYERAYSRGWIDSEWPDSLEETDLYQDRLRYHETETFSRRLEQGEMAKVRHHVGSQSDEIDVSGWHDIERIRDIVSDRHLRLYEYGEPGSGKTSAGCLAARHWLEQQRDEGHDDAYVITNIRTLASEDESIIWVDNWADLKDRVYADMDDVLAENVSPVLFLFDEASSQASGGGKDGWETGTKLATLVYKIRKFGGAIIIIGHDGKDLHPAVRELCMVLHKESKKQARFYETITNRNPKQPITPQIEGWPDSKWSPNDKDPAPWSWDDGQDDEIDGNSSHIARDDAFRELAIWTVVQEKTRNPDDPPSNGDIANKRLYGEYSAEWVRRRWNEYQDGEHGEVVGEIQQAIA
ncbi:ATP-binding protein [Natrinema amylolyticum]|uniref:ATP-binding protein n=1 Tax=Natrinema amylolyticum TaxID=2878679 RepID=UPI001CFC139A|nr:ATP-binding protein [Natrinema amylolyticum]